MKIRKNYLIAFGIFLTGGILVCTVFLFIGIRLRNIINSPYRHSMPAPVRIPVSLEEIISSCANGECIHTCIDHVKHEGLESDLNSTYDLNEETVLVYYRVKNNDIFEPRLPDLQEALIPYQKNSELHNRIWRYFTNIIPLESRPNLVSFVVFVSNKWGGVFEDTITENWVIKYNLLMSSDAYETTQVLVHEHGHYLTLNTTQIIPWDVSFICSQEVLYGCQKPDSYLNLFFEKFWRDIYPEWKDINENPDDLTQEMKSFYDKNRTMFVTEYAATNPLEDIAESWTAFILQPTPTGQSIADQKIRFFDQFPELVELRYEILKGICTYKQVP